jgi:glycosyltransferase involved in cell wall biosynthesis
MALSEHDMLAYFATTYLDHPDYPTARTIRRVVQALRPAYVKQLDRRAFHQVAFDKVRTHPTLEFLRTFSSAILRNEVIADAVWEVQDHEFDRWVARHLPATVDAVYCYDHAALATFHAARRKGVYRIIEQPAPHFASYDRISGQQLALYPEIRNASSDLYVGRRAERRNERKRLELDAASCVLCNSSFTKRTFIDAGVDAEKIEVIPLGFPSTVTPRSRSPLDPVVFLNAGTQNLRKGLHLLYRAWRSTQFRHDEAELWLVGKMLLPEELRRDLPGRVRIIDSVPHEQLMELYLSASIFVLPRCVTGLVWSSARRCHEAFL